ncbi:MAG: hypothetical protein IPH75_00055 [bacterium]|nr:hypothetical protein [bacterium]
MVAWDGDNWVPLGSGSNGSVNTILSRDSDLVVGGAFTGMGDQTASVIARWTKGCCDGMVGNVNLSTDDLIDLSDLSVFITYLSEPGAITLGCAQEADINGGGVDLTDLSLMIGYLTNRPRPDLPLCP